MKTFTPKLILLTVVLLIGFSAMSQQKLEQVIYFGFNKYQLSKENKEPLNSLIQKLSASSDYSISIAGFADQIGTEKYNQALASKRARGVKDYLLKKVVDSIHFVKVGVGSAKLNQEKSNAKRRKVIITIEVKQPETQLSYGKYGTQVVTEKNEPVVVKEFFSAQEMIKDSMYALDENNNVLISDGMISICRSNATLDRTGKFYEVKMPGRGEMIDTSMLVWLEQKDSKKRTRWKETRIKITPDSSGWYYLFKIPIGKWECIRINLDKICLNKSMLVYVTTYKPLKFDDVAFISKYDNSKQALDFSAKVDDSTWVFSCRYNCRNLNDMRFRGFFKHADKDSIIIANLEDCIMLNDKGQSIHYYVCDSCFNKLPKQVIVKKDTVVTKVAPMASPPPPKKNKRTFFTWFGNLFKSKSKRKQ